MRPHSAKRIARPRPSRTTAQDGAVAFLDQLSTLRYVLDIRPQAATGPFVRKVKSQKHPSCREAPPTVLLLSRSRDSEFDAVANLFSRVGVPIARINADELADVGLLAVPDRRVVRVNGRWLQPTVSWLRHFSAQAIDGDQGNAHDMFLRESWSSVADQLVEIAATAIRSHRPALLAQLRLAERFGIEVPRTVLTTDPCQAKEMLPSARLIIKAAHQHFVEVAPGSLAGVFPVIAANSRLVPLPRPGPPVIVQEYIDHDAELRVYYVAGQVYGFQIVKAEPADPWLHGDQVRVSVANPMPKVIQASRQLASALSMRYCAFDFLIRDGQPIFLEMNPEGDWRWFESKAGTTAVTIAVARMLCDLHRAYRPIAAVESRRQTEVFDLLTFLIG